VYTNVNITGRRVLEQVRVEMVTGDEQTRRRRRGDLQRQTVPAMTTGEVSSPNVLNSNECSKPFAAT